MADTAAPHDPPHRPRRRLALWLAPALLLAALVVCEALGWPFLRGPVERALASGLAREVSLGEGFRLHLLPRPRLSSDHLVIGAPANGPWLRDAQGRAQPFADARRVELVLPWRSALALLRGGAREEPLFVRSLVVDRLEMALLRDAGGVSNWRFGAPKPEDERREPVLPDFGRLLVRDGRLHVEDAPQRLLLRVALRTEEGSAAAAPASAASAAQAPAAGARLQASAEGRWRDSPVQGRLQTSGLLPLVASDAGSPPVPFALQLRSGDSQLQLEGRAGDVLRLSALDGSYRLAGPSLAAIGDVLSITLPQTPAFVMQGRLRKDGRVWQTAVRELALGSSRLGGEFRYDPTGRVPKLSGKLVGQRLALPDLGPAFGGDGRPDRAPPKQAKANANAADGRVLPQREFDLPSLAVMNADIAVDLASVHLGTPQLDRLAPLSGRLVLRDRVLAIEQLVAKASGGEVRGAISLDARERSAPRWAADLRWSGVRLERFVKPRNARAAPEGLRRKARAEGGNGAEAASARAELPGYVSGALSGAAKLEGRGNSTAAMLGSLDGQVQMWVREGAISHLLLEMGGIDVAESLGIVIRGKDENLPLRCAVAQMSVRDGVVQPEVAVMDTSDTTVQVGGSLSLAQEQLALVVRALPKDKSPIALRSPVHVEGTFAKPKVRLDVGRIGLRAAAAVALASAVNPLVGLLALVDLGEDEKAVCQDALARLQPRAAARAAR